MTREQRVRLYANHLGLTVRGGNGAFKLVERYGKKREIGTYRSVDTLERGIERYGERVLREPKTDISDPFSPNENRTTRVMPAWRRTSVTTLVDSGVNASKMPQLVKVSRSVICCAKSLIVRADLTGPSL
jgi:hypothetical protein